MLTDGDDQILERLQLDGLNLPLATQPLAGWRPACGTAPAFVAPHAALRRGYVGHWAVVERRLALLAIYGRLADGRAASLAALFPDRPQPVVADWYSGTLRVRLDSGHHWAPDGRRVRVARELLLDVERGLVVARRERALPASGAVAPGPAAAPARRPGSRRP